jgi:predicted transposase YdaD
MTDRKEAEAFFKANLDAPLVEQFDWDTLLLEGSHFIDDSLKLSESDILFRNALKISSSFLKESILFILNLDYAEEDE